MFELVPVGDTNRAASQPHSFTLPIRAHAAAGSLVLTARSLAPGCSCKEGGLLQQKCGGQGLQAAEQVSTPELLVATPPATS